MSKSSRSIRNRIYDLTRSLLFDPHNTQYLGFLLFYVDFLINFFVIQQIKYTEIDWQAYMQEVSGYLNGTNDYMKLKGDTGPLVYPAGFVYIFSILYKITSHGTNIRLAQYIFMIFYGINLLLVIRIYNKTSKCPPYVFIFMCCTSYRVHSIFVLRLFNDPIAMIGLFLAVNLFLDKKWFFGSIIFSFAVSVKMNIMLFAPGLLVLMLYETGLIKTIIQLMLCALVQIVLAVPFLLENPSGYLMRAFDFGRQFTFKWTVNWRFLPEDLFLNPYFHILLLMAHLITLLCFASLKWRTSFPSLFKLIDFRTNLHDGKNQLDANQIVTVLFTSNFIGMCFSRSLHYQFYIWYYHSIPYLLWSTNFSSSVRLLIFGLIEMCWNTYPSTNFSSFLLHFSHVVTLVGIWRCQSIDHLVSTPTAAVVADKDK